MVDLDRFSDCTIVDKQTISPIGYCCYCHELLYPGEPMEEVEDGWIHMDCQWDYYHKESDEQ